MTQNGIIILAAGQGTRMQSALPKVLHTVGGKPMVTHLVDLADSLQAEAPIVIYGHQGEQLKAALSTYSITWVKQTEQLGTGHAVLQALPHLHDEVIYFILVGDAPLIRQNTLTALAQSAENSGIAVLTVHLDNPFGYGRIVRHANGYVEKIVEQKDADSNEQNIQEINSGVFAIRGDLLKALLPKIGNDNAQNEYYLTDIVALANDSGHPVAAYVIDDMGEVLGCNNKIQLAELERIYQRRQAEQLMTDGATLADPARIDIRGEVTVGADCFIDVNCVFIGAVRLGDHVTIEANCIIKDAVIGSGTQIKSHTVIENATIGENADIGPFARLRPNTQLANQAKIGNFVETKNAQIAPGAKVNHLSYVGDAIVGEQANVGAGTITCNYDGANKHQTVIGKKAFIGSNTALVAPVNVGENVTVAAGSTITKDVLPNTLAIARGRQRDIANWQRPSKKK
ncbi:MAG: UDP-N-acetylglucosamine diphosphorylase/glucosamine-1-phosphate N-acetyltransferase [Gammaproteobacteria bacterium]|nr:MAG: UDP-N-acetylglucosamine diphosphorylase/glucosamine-1-phosphate N-acetyltransferase [Gammaproteobacteria bacterium]